MVSSGASSFASRILDTDNRDMSFQTTTGTATTTIIIDLTQTTTADSNSSTTTSSPKKVSFKIQKCNNKLDKSTPNLIASNSSGANGLGPATARNEDDTTSERHFSNDEEDKNSTRMSENLNEFQRESRSMESDDNFKKRNSCSPVNRTDEPLAKKSKSGSNSTS